MCPECAEQRCFAGLVPIFKPGTTDLLLRHLGFSPQRQGFVRPFPGPGTRHARPIVIGFMPASVTSVPRKESPAYGVPALAGRGSPMKVFLEIVWIQCQAAVDRLKPGLDTSSRLR